jgi:hypothetical protein
MLVLALLDLLLVATVLLVAVTQLLIPLLRGRPVFPIFRRERRLASELAEAESELEQARLERQVEEKRRAAEALRSDDRE